MLKQRLPLATQNARGSHVFLKYITALKKYLCYICYTLSTRHSIFFIAANNK